MISPDGQSASILQEASPSSLRDDDYLTVVMLAAGLASILERRQRVRDGRSLDAGLLPAPWRVAFTRLWWRQMRQAQAPIDSDLDLIALCTEPFITWPVRLDLSDTDLQCNLLDSDDELSEFGVQSARLGRHDIEAEWVENRVHRALRDAATANGPTDEKAEHAYATLRRFLIDNVVLADRELRPLERRFPAADANRQTYVRALIDAAFHSRPAREPQRYSLCPGCGNVREPFETACLTPGCLGGEPIEKTVNPLAAIYEQKRATRKYIHDPGLVEARIVDALRDGAPAPLLRVTPYPSVDALDILIEFLDPDDESVIETWGVDAKDQVSARLLGRGFDWPAEPHCDRRYLALPRHRATQPGYVTDLETELEGRVSNVRVIDEDALIAGVRARAKRGPA